MNEYLANHQIHTNMRKDRKTIYEAPQTRVFEMKTEGVLCASGETESFLSGNSYDDSIFD